MNLSIKSRAEYMDFYKELSGTSCDSNGESIIKLKPKYGRGNVKTFPLTSYASLIIMDLCFEQEVKIHYELPKDFLEICCCFNGCVQVEERGREADYFEKNQVCFSTADDSAESVSGYMAYLAGQRYQGVSLAFDRDHAKHYCGSGQDEIWNQFLKCTGNEMKQCFHFAKCAPAVKTAFLQIYNNNMSFTLKRLFIESKIMEIISLLIFSTENRNDDKKVSFSEADVRQVKMIPSLFEKNMLEPPTIADLARMTTMNIRKLQQVFKTVYGETIYEYHKKIRMEHAAALLSNSSDGIDEIAYQAGYCSACHFRTAFKQYFGFSPTKYRKNRVASFL